MAGVWALGDIHSRALIPINTALDNNPGMPPYEKKEDDLSFEKIKSPEKIDFQKEFEVRYNDLDVNEHANNGNYIVWAFEPLDFDFKTSHKIKTLDMIYKKELKFGEKVISQIEFQDDLTTVHRLQNSQNEDLCLIQCRWI